MFQCPSTSGTSTATTGVNGSALPIYSQAQTQAQSTGNIDTVPSDQLPINIPIKTSSASVAAGSNLKIGDSRCLNGIFPGFSCFVGDYQRNINSQNLSNSQTISNSQNINNPQSISGYSGLNSNIGMFCNNENLQTTSTTAFQNSMNIANSNAGMQQSQSQGNFFSIPANNQISIPAQNQSNFCPQVTPQVTPPYSMTTIPYGPQGLAPSGIDPVNPRGQVNFGVTNGTKMSQNYPCESTINQMQVQGITNSIPIPNQIPIDLQSLSQGQISKFGSTNFLIENCLQSAGTSTRTGVTGLSMVPTFQTAEPPTPLQRIICHSNPDRSLILTLIGPGNVPLQQAKIFLPAGFFEPPPLISAPGSLSLFHCKVNSSERLEAGFNSDSLFIIPTSDYFKNF